MPRAGCKTASAAARALSLCCKLASVFPFLALFANAEPSAETKRPMSLAECIRAALEHNLDIKIERYNPQIAQYNLRLAYSAYEPTFNGGGTHSFNLSPGGLDQQNRPFSGTTTESDAFSAGLVGLLPSGLNYSLGGNL